MTDPHLFVLVGATGDLARRKLIPALYGLHRAGALGERWALVGAAPEDLSEADYRGRIADALRESGVEDADLDDWCARRLRYASLANGPGPLAERVREVEADAEMPGHRLFDLAVPPDAVCDVVGDLADAGLLHAPDDEAWSRVLVEKPFGTSGASARALSEALHRHVAESQLYRIDHYLAKDALHNLDALRTDNAPLAGAWHRGCVERVTITASETLGVDDRGAFYDGVGVVRDVVQNHVLEILATVASEPDTDDARQARLDALRCARPADPEAAWLGQYGASEDGDLSAYADAEGVAPGSRTPTWARLTFEVDSERWRGVPFVVEAGKRMAEDRTEVEVAFQAPDGGPGARLVYAFKPAEAVTLDLRVRRASGLAGGPASDVIRTATLCPPEARDADAYAALLRAAARGDRALFVGADEAEAAWALVDPVLEAHADERVRFDPYPAGTDGPPAVPDLATA